MLKVISTIFVLILGLTQLAIGSERQMINPIGVSAKGQFVAFEEYSFVPLKKTYAVSIRIMNVWTKEFVGQKIYLEYPARRPYSLKSAREKARLDAREELLKFNITT